MNYYTSHMTDDEIRYICDIIPPNMIITYFKTNPKKFSEIKRGFRPNKISDVTAKKLLYKYVSNDFISSFINKVISKWLDEIADELSKERQKTDNENIVYLNILPQSFFANNIALYFKLSETKKDEDYVLFLQDAVNYIYDTKASKKNLQEDLKNSSFESKSFTKETEKVKKEHKKLEKKYKTLKKELEIKTNDLSQEVEKNARLIKDFEELTKEKRSLLSKINKLEDEYEKEKSKRVALYNELSELKLRTDSYFVFDDSESYKHVILENYDAANTFKENLKYSLKEIMQDSENEYNKYGEWLLTYICNIAFLGRPILIKENTSFSLISCFNYALTGNQQIDSLAYTTGIGSKSIIEFLEKTNATVVCLDNFIGNYNETELLSICSHFRNKIIFFTYMYERTLNYLSNSIFEYCEYINVNRLKSFALNKKLSELVENVNITIGENTSKNETRNTKALKRMLTELTYSPSVLNNMCSLVSNDKDLDSLLLFNLIPYLLDVKKLDFAMLSSRLVEYAQKHQSSIMMDWIKDGSDN